MGSIYWRNLISLILAKKARKYPKTGASQAFLKITFSWKWTRLKFKWCASASFAHPMTWKIVILRLYSTNQIARAFGQQYIKKKGIYHFGLR